MKLTFNKGFVAVILLVLVSLVYSNQAKAQGSYYIKGVVKELHAEKLHNSKPLVLANIRVLQGGVEQFGAVSKTDGVFSVDMPQLIPNLILQVKYKDYEVLDEEPLRKIEPIKDINSPGIYVLMCSKAKLQQLEDDYYEKVKKRISGPYEARINKLKETLDTKSDAFRDSTKRLSDSYNDQLGKARKFAQHFVRTEFQDPDNPLFKAYQFYLQGSLDSCEYYYETDNFLHEISSKHSSDNRIIVDNWLIYAEAKAAKADWEAVDKIYLSAIELANAKNKFTVVKAYVSFLIKMRKYEKARPYLTMKLDMLKDTPDTFGELLFTNYQFATIYHTDRNSKEPNPLADPTLCAKYAGTVMAYKDRILKKDSNLSNTAVLLNTMHLIAEEQTKDEKRIKKLWELSEVSAKINPVAFDTLDVEVLSPADVHFFIGDYYSEREKTVWAIMYYKRSISDRRKHIFRSKLNAHITDEIFSLYTTYFFVASEAAKYSASSPGRKGVVEYLLKESKYARIFQDKLDTLKLKNFLVGTANGLQKGDYRNAYLPIIKDYLKNGKSIFIYPRPDVRKDPEATF